MQQLGDKLTLRTVSDSHLKLVCLLSTSAYSALEVLHIMRYINLLTYLLTYLLITMKLFSVSDGCSEKGVLNIHKHASIQSLPVLYR